MCQSTRIKIAALLSHHELCVCELQEILGMSQSAVSQHIRVFKEADLVNEHREGQLVFYSINRKRLREALEGFLAILDQDPNRLPELEEQLAQLAELQKNPKVECKRRQD